MDDTLRMDEAQALADFERDMESFLAGQGSIFLQLLRQRQAFDKLHRQKGCCRVVSICGQQEQLVDAAYLLSAYLSCELYLLAKALVGGWGSENSGADGLEGYGSELQIFGLIDFAHTTSSNRSNDAEAAKDGVSG